MGYALFPALFKNEVVEFLSVYREMLREMPASDPYFQPPMTGTPCIGSAALRRRICDDVSRIMAPHLGAVLDDYRFMGAGFRVKQEIGRAHV